jgi:hypothetical protein
MAYMQCKILTFIRANPGVIIQRKILLKKQGKSAGFIEVLLLDAQTWSDSRSLLQTQVRTARDILTDFFETKYLQDEIVDAVAALRKLEEAINKMEAEVLKEIKDLDDKTQKMIELVGFIRLETVISLSP